MKVVVSCDIRYICPAEQASAAGFVEFEGKLRICQLPLPPVLSAGEMLHRPVPHFMRFCSRSVPVLLSLLCNLQSSRRGFTFCPRDSAQRTATHDIPHIARRHASARCHRGSGKDSPCLPNSFLLPKHPHHAPTACHVHLVFLLAHKHGTSGSCL